MKVAILSMQEVKNYGSFLQAFSLKKTIESLGNTCEFINIIPGEQLGKAIVNYCVAKRTLFSIIDSLSKAFAWFASFLSTVTTTLNQFK